VNANDAAWITKPQLADFLGEVQLSKWVFSRVIQASESLRYGFGLKDLGQGVEVKGLGSMGLGNGVWI